MDHPLHLAVADAIRLQLPDSHELLRDPACGGSHHLPLFVGPRKGRDTRMCLVDLLVVSRGKVVAIGEIEESDFLPTKICGKFLQAVLATHFVHKSCETALPYADRVFFLQVLDSSKCLKPGTRKDSQAALIEREIRSLLPLKVSRIVYYSLLFVAGPDDEHGLHFLGSTVARALI